MLRQLTLWDIPSVISLPESADGATHCGLPDGLTTGQCGQVLARASHSAQQGGKKECRTNGTCGPYGSTSSASAGLSRSLASRLKQRLTTDGSILFAMTWKMKDTPSGRSVCLLRASAHRTSDSGCGSWPTPTTRDWKDGAESNTPIKAQLGRTVWLATWPTPKAQDGMRGGQAKRAIGTTRHGSNLNDFFQLAAWATPRANYAAKQGNVSPDKRNGLPAQVLEPGTRINRLGRVLTGFIAETNAGGQLDPELSRWLMGYPAEWAHCRPTETRLSRMSRRK